MSVKKSSNPVVATLSGAIAGGIVSRHGFRRAIFLLRWRCHRNHADAARVAQQRAAWQGTFDLPWGWDRSMVVVCILLIVFNPMYSR